MPAAARARKRWPASWSTPSSASPRPPLRLAYDDTDPLATKIEKVARQIYGAGSVSFAPAARRRLPAGRGPSDWAHCPVCIAKTQFSFSADAKRYGAVEGFGLRHP